MAPTLSYGCLLIKHRWLFLFWNALVATSSFVIVILLSIRVSLDSVTPRTSRSDPKFQSNYTGEPLTKSITLERVGGYTNQPPLANLNVTVEEVNEFLGLPNDSYLSSKLLLLGRCRMVVNLQRGSGGNGYDPKMCNRVDAEWVVVALSVAAISLAEFVFGLLFGKFPTDLTHDQKKFNCRGVQAFICAVLWLIPVCYFFTRRADVDLWYIEYGQAHEVAYYEESIRWLAAGGMCTANMVLKIIEILICCCTYNEGTSKSDTEATAKRRGPDPNVKAIDLGSRRSWECDSIGGGGSQKSVGKDGSSIKKPSSWFQPGLCFVTMTDEVGKKVGKPADASSAKKGGSATATATAPSASQKPSRVPDARSSTRKPPEVLNLGSSSSTQRSSLNTSTSLVSSKKSDRKGSGKTVLKGKLKA